MIRFSSVLCWIVLLFFMSVFILPDIPVDAATADSDPASAEEVSDDFQENDNSLSGFSEEADDKTGFSDEAFTDAVDLDQISASSDEERLLTWGGFIKEDLGYSYDHEPTYPEISKIRTILNLKASLRLLSDWRAEAVWNGFYDAAYRNFGRDKFTEETLDAYESESEIRDLFIDGSVFRWLRFKLGRQIIAWGQSETQQITDVANPRDNRELGMVDIEDARMPVLATKISLLADAWEVNLVAIHENRPNKIPTVGSEFDPLVRFRNQFTIRDEEIPENSAENTEYLVRVFKTFNGGDLGLVWADVYDDSFYLDFYSYDAIQNRLSLTPRHQRTKTVGFSGNLVRSSWLFKTEFARKTGVAIARNQTNLTQQILNAALLAQMTGTAYFSRETQIIKTWSQKNLLQLMLGFEYSGLDDITISLEGDIEKIEDHEDTLGSKETNGSVTLRCDYTALNDTLNATVLWFHLTDSNGDVYRINLGYDLIDALNISGGIILYEASKTDAQVYPYRKNDRLFAALKYSF